jgi:hypothetical protein
LIPTEEIEHLSWVSQELEKSAEVEEEFEK